MNFEEKQFRSLQYLFLPPKDFDKSKKYPALIFLHGIGARGDMGKLRSHPFFTESVVDSPDFPMVVFAPLDPPGIVWFDVFETLCAFTDEVCATDFVDSSRVYLMGASMGGYGTWMLGMSRHEKIAAIVPICGGGTYWDVGRLKDVPVWAFHGALDQSVSPDESRRMVDAVNRRGGNAKLTIYPERDHNAWSDTFRNPEVFKWLLSHRKIQKDVENTESEPNLDPAHFG